MRLIVSERTQGLAFWTAMDGILGADYWLPITTKYLFLHLQASNFLVSDKGLELPYK